MWEEVNSAALAKEEAPLRGWYEASLPASRLERCLWPALDAILAVGPVVAAQAARRAGRVSG
jgi:hypothetical protein